jgi:hypothetical protein
VRLQRFRGRERPAATAATLVLNRSDDTLGAPVERSGQGGEGRGQARVRWRQHLSEVARALDAAFGGSAELLVGERSELQVKLRHVPHNIVTRRSS